MLLLKIKAILTLSKYTICIICTYLFYVLDIPQLQNGWPPVVLYQTIIFFSSFQFEVIKLSRRALNNLFNIVLLMQYYQLPVCINISYMILTRRTGKIQEEREESQYLQPISIDLQQQKYLKVSQAIMSLQQKKLCSRHRAILAANPFDLFTVMSFGGPNSSEIRGLCAYHEMFQKKYFQI